MECSRKFFKPPEEGGLNRDVEATETRTETVESRYGQIIEVAFRAESRGVDINSKTLGEIMYIELLASERDQIHWACSAQSNELLPQSIKNRSKAKGSSAAQLRAAVTGMVAKGNY